MIEGRLVLSATQSYEITSDCRSIARMALADMTTWHIVADVFGYCFNIYFHLQTTISTEIPTFASCMRFSLLVIISMQSCSGTVSGSTLFSRAISTAMACNIPLCWGDAGIWSPYICSKKGSIILWGGLHCAAGNNLEQQRANSMSLSTWLTRTQIKNLPADTMYSWLWRGQAAASSETISRTVQSKISREVRQDAFFVGWKPML